MEESLRQGVYEGFWKECGRISATINQLKNNLQGIRDLELRQKGVGREAGRMYVEDIAHSGNSLKASGTVPVKVVTLDEDIPEPIDIIKMDIEGAEKDALLGARNRIEKRKTATYDFRISFAGRFA